MEDINTSKIEKERKKEMGEMNSSHFLSSL
jgi:hypothetical protein